MVARLVASLLLTLALASAALAARPHRIKTEPFFPAIIGLVGTSPNPSRPGELVTARAYNPMDLGLSVSDGVEGFGFCGLTAPNYCDVSKVLTTLGVHGVQASYDGDGVFYPGVSNIHAHVVSTSGISTATTIVITPNPSPAGRPVLLTAIVAPDPGGGSVTFRQGSVTFGTVPLAGGQATLLVRPTSPGDFTAYFPGLGVYSSSFSPFVALAPTGIDEVPTLDARGFALLAGVLAIVAVIALRR